jgi:hypothetical protein
MLRKPDAQRKYESAQKRYINPLIESFFEREFPSMFGPNLRRKIAEELVDIFEQNNRDIKKLKPGQILWNVVHKDTRADSKQLKTVPVILTMVASEDISNLAKGIGVAKNRENLIARIIKEAYDQGGLLSMRDIGLLTSLDPSHVSASRKAYEEAHNVTLPHTGSLHDMGTCITHKYQIIYKYVVEKKDPTIIAKETNHSLKAVDSYLRDYNRIKLLFMDNKTVEYIKLVTMIPIHVIKQYKLIIEQYDKVHEAS